MKAMSRAMIIKKAGTACRKVLINDDDGWWWIIIDNNDTDDHDIIYVIYVMYIKAWEVGSDKWWCKCKS
jgi:hypothetical protein